MPQLVPYHKRLDRHMSMGRPAGHLARHLPTVGAVIRLAKVLATVHLLLGSILALGDTGILDTMRR